MDKIQLTEFRIAENETTQTVVNGVAVTVNKTIPYEKVLDAIQWCIDFTIYEKSFLSSPLETIIARISFLKYWTNIDFDFMEHIKTIGEIYEAYDIIAQNEIFDTVLPLVDEKQAHFFFESVHKTLESIVAYRNSAQGIIDALSTDAAENSKTIQDSLDALNDDSIKSLVNIIQAASNG